MAGPESNGAEWIEFHPRPSSGKWWTGGIGILVLLLTVGPFIPVWDESPPGLILVFIGLGLVLSALFLVPWWYFSQMRYWIGPDELVLRFGPLINERIPLNAIESVTIKGLRISPWSSFRLPGIALFDVYYRDEHTIFMCATSASQRIMLIRTGSRKYGITPDDEEAFLKAIHHRSAEKVARAVD